MSVSVLSRRLRAAVSFPPAGETAIAAVVVTDNTTGSALVQIVLPLPPGLVTDQMVTDRKITVEVNGVEQAVFMKAARGRFPAGFLGAAGESVRMLQGHFTYSIPDTTPITAQFIVNRVRSVSDISETAITDTHLTNRRAMLPSSATYLCSTWLTFQPLLVASSENAQNDAYFNDHFDERFEALKNTDITSAFAGPATYESVLALWSRWCQTADRKYFWNAWRRARAFLDYSLPNNGTGHWTPEINPQSIVTGVTGNGRPAEHHSQRQRTFAAAYLITGQIAFYNIVCAWNGWTNAAITSEAVADDLDKVISGTWTVRFNLRGAFCQLLGVVIDATQAFGSDAGQGREMNYPVELPWYLNAWNVHVYNKGDHRDGLRGQWDEATDGGGEPAGQTPHFQIALATDWLLFYYLNVKADATVANWIKANVDIVLNDMVASTSGQPGFGQGAEWGYDYECMATQTGVASDPWTIVMHAPAVKFCEKYFGNNTVNGATYSTWYTRLINPGQTSPNHLTYDWKIFGEAFGYNMMGGYLDQVGIPTGLPSSIRSPTQY